MFVQMSWMAIVLFKVEFQDCVKLGRSHLMVDALSNNSKLIGVPNQTSDDHMFTLQHEWL